MARFHLDHNVSQQLARILRTQGHDVTTARDLRLERASDGLHFLTAAGRGAVLLMHNERDFLLLYGLRLNR